MPKRIVDGDGVWRSDKIALVQPPAYRAEFANLIPLATANGTFEVEPRRIWATVYSFNRPDISPEDTKKILDEFERVKLLFRWTDPRSGKRWGYWVGIEKSGRLPAESRRGTHEVVGPEPPRDQLEAFLAQGTETLVEDHLGNGNHTGANGQPDGTGLCLGLGVGLASGKGSGAGNLPPTPLQKSEGGWGTIFSTFKLALKSDLSTSFVNSANFEESAYDRYFRDMQFAAVSGEIIFVESADLETWRMAWRNLALV